MQTDIRIEDKIEWLKPERLMKLCDGHKSGFGINRLLIIGIGKNGVDCLMRCKHKTERRFGKNESMVRYLAIGEETLLSEAECYGSVLADDEKVPILPDEAIYKYLNNPARLPEYIQDRFDSGLKNYSPATPTYGLGKRQCGRVALFHNIKQITKAVTAATEAFAKSDKSVEVVITGNLGDAFFGGMMIDLAYLVKDMFGEAKYPVHISAYMFAGDTAKLFESDTRDLGNYYANSVITKEELDLFQCKRTPYSQRFTQSLEVSSDKPPYNTCFIVAAEKSYGRTLDAAAEKILARMEIVFNKDDEAERIVSYNMMRKNAPHDFRYLSCGVDAAEVPIGKIMSYLCVSMLMVFNRLLNKNIVGEAQLSALGSKVTPTADFLASKGGFMPQLDFDEKSNPTFAVKNVKMSIDAPLNYVHKWAEDVGNLIISGGALSLESITAEIIEMCEAAKTDLNKGPFYSTEIIKKCLADIRVAMAKIKSDSDDLDEQQKRTRDKVNASYMKIKTSSLFANRSMDQFLADLREYAESVKQVRAGEALLPFYQSVHDKLKEYLDETLAKDTEIFEKICANRDSVISEVTAINDDVCVRDVISISDPAVREKLDALIEKTSETALGKMFKKSNILSLPDDTAALAREMVGIVSELYGDFLSKSFAEFCEYFGVGTVSDVIGGCLERVEAAAPASDDFTLDRAVCPKNTKSGDIASLREEHKGMGYIWNSSVLNLAAVVTQIKGGAQFDKFPDYTEWENMRYAYVNDSLKKHGIHIFGS